jgi:threonine dehydratase
MAVPISLADIQAAHDVIRDLVRNTPMKRSTTLSGLTGSDFHLKLENFQRTGSFKVRGALNKIHSLSPDERSRGVVAASAGNHAQGTAYAATKANVRSDIFMPEDATHSKLLATRGYGARVHLAGSDYQEAYEAAREFCEQHDRVFVHAFDDEKIIAGQGTLGLEIAQDMPTLDTLLVPIGGGGLISGVATAIKALRPEVRIIGVQAEGASTVAPSLAKGRVVMPDHVKTMADGIACRRLGDLTFDCIQRHVDEVVTVSESEIAASILFLLERVKVAAEGAGAVTLAAAMHGKVDLGHGTTCAVVSGGNIDMTLLARIIDRGMVKEGRIVNMTTALPDKPGAIAELLQLLAFNKANVMDIHHDRHRVDMSLLETHVEVHMEMRGPEHVAALRVAMQQAGYRATFGGI